MTLRRYAAAVALSTTLAFITPAVVDAASVTNSTINLSVGDVDISSSNTRLSGDNIRFAQALSSTYHRPVAASEIIRLRADFDFGLGDISLIYATAIYSGRSVDEISELRHKNMGWGEIAKFYGVKVKDLKKGNYDTINAAHGRGVDVIYVEIDDDNRYYDHHDDRYKNHHDNDYRDRDNDRDDKKDHGKGNKKDDKRDDKHENSKGHGNKK
ncbi:MAG: hypothetical protein K0R78_1044 [Pelosinus sp.]|jgi:hypothetical protein|nr:hypothetical protein [Pelosinus sp.]